MKVIVCYIHIFPINKKGICQIYKNKKNKWNNRLNILKNEIQQCIDIHFEDILI